MNIDISKFNILDISSTYLNVTPTYVVEVKQLSDLEFQFFTFFNKDINDWIRYTNHENMTEKRNGKTIIRFLDKSGAVEFKLRFTGI